MNSIEQGTVAITSPLGGQLRKATGGGTEGVDFAAALVERSADLPTAAEDACAIRPRPRPGRNHAATGAVANASDAAARGRRGFKRDGGVENHEQPPAVDATVSTLQVAAIAIAVLDRALAIPQLPSSPQPTTDTLPGQAAKSSRQRMSPDAGAIHTTPECAWDTDGASDHRLRVGEAKSRAKLSVTQQATFFSPARTAAGSGIAVAEQNLSSLQYSAYKEKAPALPESRAHASPPAAAVHEKPNSVVDLGTGISLPQQSDEAIPGPLSTSDVGGGDTVSGPRMPPSALWISSGVALRTLSLQLSPEQLGLVSIALTHADGALNVSIQLEQSDAFDEIEGGRSEIAGRLSDAGYAVKELIVSRSDVPFAPPVSNDLQNDGAIGNGASCDMDRSGGGEHHSREARNREAHGMAAEATPAGKAMGQLASEPTPWVRLSGSRKFISV